ncbi:deSI-like protein At4g17486 [Curcuma longa]|uniref:deSI-like protein At4g17486 n=1 Tax=Curcuma longa TaxID=136217 RepID=UPI003D9E5DDA
MISRGTSRERRPEASASVYLNVYDLTPINGYAYWVGLGVYHSGVQVHGVEYAYGAHEHPMTGIFEGEPRQCPGFAFRKSILIGRTELGSRDVRALMEGMAADYSGDTYNLISKNCNHFCDDACLRLTGTHIPKWVNRLAKIGFLCKCVLPVRVAAVRKRGAEDGRRGVDADKRRLRSNSARFHPEGATTPPSSISKPEVTITSRSTGGRKLRRSASSSSAGGLAGRGGSSLC